MWVILKRKAAAGMSFKSNSIVHKLVPFLILPVITVISGESSGITQGIRLTSKIESENMV